MPKNGLDRKAGYDAEENIDESKPLRRILGWFAQGGYVYAAQKANDAGIPTAFAKYAHSNKKNRQPSDWDHRNVAELVKHARVYATGIDEKTIGGKVYRVGYPKLIDEKLYAAVQRRLGEHAVKNRDVFMSTGFVTTTGASRGSSASASPVAADVARADDAVEPGVEVRRRGRRSISFALRLAHRGIHPRSRAVLFEAVLHGHAARRAGTRGELRAAVHDNALILALVPGEQGLRYARAASSIAAGTGAAPGAPRAASRTAPGATAARSAAASRAAAPRAASRTTTAGAAAVASRG